MSWKKLFPFGLMILAMITGVNPTGCPEEFQDTVQSNVPGVVWNEEPASNGGTLRYCPFGTRCFLQFSAINSSSLPLSPDIYIDGVCYPFTELEKKFPGSSANATQYPLHNFLFDCGNITRFRVVYNETYYTREYKLERSDSHCIGTPTTPTSGGTSSSASLPSSTPAVTSPTPWTVDHVGIGTGVTVSLAVIVIGIVPIIIVLCCWRRRKKRRDGTGTSSPQSTQMPLTPAPSLPTSVAQTPETDDHSSVTETVPGPSAVPSEVDDISFSITVEGNSMRRDVGDGGEEMIPPLSVPAANEDGNMKLVAGRYAFC